MTRRPERGGSTSAPLRLFNRPSAYPASPLRSTRYGSPRGLTPRGHHTLGSMNHLMLFATDYLELLGFGEGGANRPELAPFPIGLNGLVFKTADAEATHAHAAKAGLPILPVQSFSRPVRLDG